MIGDYLKKCRQGTNLSLEDISSATMIKLSYLKALEDEDFQALPCEVFTRGYIRVYLEFLSLDSSEGLRIFQDEGVHTFKSNDSKDSNRVALSAGFVKVPAEVIIKPNTFNAPNIIDKNKPGYTRNIVYLLVLLAFLAVVVFSARAFFSVTKKSNASVIRPVDRSGNEALRAIPSSGRIHFPELAPDQTSVSSEKKAVSKSPDSKKASPRPSGKTKESINLMRKPAANPVGAGVSEPQNAPGPELQQLKDISKVVQKMKKMTSSLKSLKTSIVKVKSDAAARNSSKSAKPIKAEPVTPPVESGGTGETIDAEKDPDRSAVDTAGVFFSSRGITVESRTEALFVAPEGVTEQCGLSEKSGVF